VRGIQEAHVQGIPVYTTNSANWSTISSLLDTNPNDPDQLGSAFGALVSLVNQGYTVTTPEKSIRLGQYSGPVYFAVLSTPSSFVLHAAITPTEGGPTNGGYDTGFRPPPPAVDAGHTVGETTAGDPVNIANGNLTREETDFAIPNIGLPLVFRRS